MSQVAQYTIDGISLGSLYALFALGIGLIFGIMQLINFAHGELIMIGGYVLVFALAPTPIRVLVVVLIVIFFALAMERVAFRPIRGASLETLLVTSFAVSFFLQNLAILTIGGLPRSARVLPALTGTVSIGGFPFRLLDLVTIAVTAVLLIALVLFLGKTRLGVQMRAAAENFRMARALGVRANTIVATAFAISGLLAAVASVFLVAQTGVVRPTMGLAPVLGAFIATIIGGLGSLSGAVLGGYLLGALTVALHVGLPPALNPYRDAFVFAAVVAILIVRPQGLLGKRSRLV
jgi:branched-chain amino acid transport system permease protein